MSALKRIFEFYINSSIHVALAVLSLVYITVLEFDLQLPNAYWYFVFFGSITGYNFVKYAPVAGLHHRSLARSLKTIQVFSFLCFAFLVYFSFQLSFTTLLYTGIFGALTILYAIPFLKSKILRTVKGLKIFVVALVWAGVTVFIPVLASQHTLTVDTWITFTERFLIVIALILPFEIRDLPYDDSVLGTFPQLIGLVATNILVTGLTGVAFILEAFKNAISYPYAISLLLVCLLTSFATFFADKNQPKYYASFWVEGIPIVWLGTFLLLRHILL